MPLLFLTLVLLAISIQRRIQSCMPYGSFFGQSFIALVEVFELPLSLSTFDSGFVKSP